ncbi:MAG TPA: C45 family peptidase [Burkholderiales bacterium]|nr:C45 family peptidase [Burkholderiales bacterium]
MEAAAMFPLIDVAGTPRERGRTYGRLARAQIERSIATYAGLFAYCGIEWSAAQERAAAYGDAIARLDAELLEEIAGIAEGSRRNVNEILALNARTEILPASYLAPRYADFGECTALAVPPALSETGGTLLAQNWDWVGAQRRALVLLRIHETDGSACLTLTEAGMLAKIGLNRHGFGVCLNILRSSADGAKPGVPVHALLRALLKCKDVERAQAFAAGFSYGASSNVLCADAGGAAANLEFSPQGLQVLRDDGAVLCHTNHFLRAAGGPGEAALPPSLSSEPRLARAQALAATQHALGVAGLKRILRDESAGFLSICRRPDPALAAEVRLESVASVIMELEQRRMHVAPDVPALAEYRTVTLLEPVPA